MKQYATKTALSAALLLVVMIMTAWPPALKADVLSSTIAVTDQELSDMRGGFVTNEGLLVSFGIERAIYVNGVLNTASNFTISNIDGNIGLQHSAPSLSGVNAVKVVQIGPAGSNVFSPANITGNILPGGFTVIQNSLNHQFIKNMTIFNASVTNMSLFRDMNLTSSISQQMIHSVR